MDRTSEAPRAKPCQGCSGTCVRREREGMAKFAARGFCSAACRGVAMRRPPVKPCLTPGCGGEVRRREDEPGSSFRARKKCDACVRRGRELHAAAMRARRGGGLPVQLGLAGVDRAGGLERAVRLLRRAGHVVFPAAVAERPHRAAGDREHQTWVLDGSCVDLATVLARGERLMGRAG